jgi:hypothetical protein
MLTELLWQIVGIIKIRICQSVDLLGFKRHVSHFLAHELKSIQHFVVLFCQFAHFSMATIINDLRLPRKSLTEYRSVVPSLFPTSLWNIYNPAPETRVSLFHTMAERNS